jgi:hypothetical protein
MRRPVVLLFALLLVLVSMSPVYGQDMYDVRLSGSPQFLDTAHFRIHYTLTGVDAVTLEYVAAVAEALEQTWRVQVVELGWSPPPPDNGVGGNDLYDVFLKDLTDEEALGITSPEEIVGDNPATPDVVEQYAATSYLMVENDFEGFDLGNGTVLSLMRATVAHEFNHAIQFAYDYGDAHDWIYEATATWMETVAAGDDQDATGYVSATFDYPEACFGSVTNPGDADRHYGEWLFMEHLAQHYGRDFVRRVWEVSRDLEGFAVLEAALTEVRTPSSPTRFVEASPPPLEDSSTPVPSAPRFGGNLGTGATTPTSPPRPPVNTGNLGVRPGSRSGGGSATAVPMQTQRSTSALVDEIRAYRVRNLARDYALAPLFNASVWLEGTIDSLSWRYTGPGMAGLGANYFMVTLPPGAYSVRVVGAALEAWSVSVDAESVTAVPLGMNGVMVVQPGSRQYIMVYNPQYDEDLSRCRMTRYNLALERATSAPQPPAFSIKYPAAHYAPLDTVWD